MKRGFKLNELNLDEKKNLVKSATARGDYNTKEILIITWITIQGMNKMICENKCINEAEVLIECLHEETGAYKALFVCLECEAVIDIPEGFEVIGSTTKPYYKF